MRPIPEFQISDRDLKRYRESVWAWDAMYHATPISFEDCLAVVKQRQEVLDDLIATYNIDDKRNWMLSRSTGEVWYED